HVVFFLFQAEDGIRDRNVTGVQTCALPISPSSGAPARVVQRFGAIRVSACSGVMKPMKTTPMRIVTAPPMRISSCWLIIRVLIRSEERRVGKECRARGERSTEQENATGRAT